MTLARYRAALLDLYLRQPETPKRLSPHDRAVAADLHRRAIPLDLLAHVIRLVRVRRAATPALPPIRSLAYYRAVLDSLTPDDLDAGYIDYVAHRGADAMHVIPDPTDPATPDRQNPALPRDR